MRWQEKDNRRSLSLEVKDEKFLELAKKMFGKRTFSSVYLVGEEFDKSWMGNSLAFLCNRRKVFMGQNLYTKGACYAAMEYARMSRVGDYLYAGPDMIEQNMGMQMIIRGHREFYPMISAGVNWYMARAECEFVLDDTSEVILYSKSMEGEELSHTVRLPGLPDRPNRATAASSVAFLHRKTEMPCPGDGSWPWKSLSVFRQTLGSSHYLCGKNAGKGE